MGDDRAPCRHVDARSIDRSACARRSSGDAPRTSSARRSDGALNARLVSFALALVAQSGAGEIELPVGSLRELAGEERVSVEIVAPRASCFVGEEVALVLRLAFEAEFLESQMVQLFRYPLDVPAQVQAPWLAGLPCARMTERAPRAGDTTSEIALG